MDTISLLSIACIRVSEKQQRKVSKVKVQKHLQSLEKDQGDVYPIDVHALGDGTYIVAGNGRHRYYAYILAGYDTIPAYIRNATQGAHSNTGSFFC